jgi:hypothetical protein
MGPLRLQMSSHERFSSATDNTGKRTNAPQTAEYSDEYSATRPYAKDESCCQAAISS